VNIVLEVTARLREALREAPATVPAAATVVLLVIWATDQAGYPLTHWAPGGLIVLVLLGMAAVLVRRGAERMPRAVLVALACLAAYTALSFLSILWAGVPGDAWEGADRTLLYLAVFALFAAWQQRGPTAALLLLGWVLAVAGLALYCELHIAAAPSGALPALLPNGRLAFPSGYPNANAAQWLMAFWPALLMARSERMHWSLRGLLAAAAVLLASIALLSQSRGSLYATPVMLVLVFAFVPRRLRTFAVLVPVVCGIAAAAPANLRVGDHLSGGMVIGSDVRAAVLASLLAAAVVGALVGFGAALESRARPSVRARARIRRGLAIAAAVIGVAVLAAGLTAAGDPVARARSAWHSFKGGYGSGGGSRLVSGLGSNRYDFYRVALDEFAANPLVGIGADNFQQQYLRHGRSTETPRYPHSVELRTLAQTGVIGALLAVVGVAAALGTAAGAMRGPDPLAAAVAAAACSVFAYWAVHGSFDWFWEFAGLGAPAFAMLGLSCSLAPRRSPARASRSAARPRVRLAAAVAAALVALALAASLAAPWLSRLEVQNAARIWTRSPAAAYASLDDAASLDPLSDEPDLLAGAIALRYGELARADRNFALALQRSPADAYALLQRGAIASATGQRMRARALLERAHALAPRETLIGEALRVVLSGRRIEITALQRAILQKAQQLA
jgi:O-antigen ligase